MVLIPGPQLLIAGVAIYAAPRHTQAPLTRWGSFHGRSHACASGGGDQEVDVGIEPSLPPLLWIRTGATAAVVASAELLTWGCCLSQRADSWARPRSPSMPWLAGMVIPTRAM